MLNSKPTLETAFAHRSIRKFSDEPISAEMFDAIIQAGQMASTSSFMQAVSIVRVTDRAIRAQIREVCANAYQGKLGHHYVENCAEFLVFCVDTARHTQLVPDAQIEWTEVLLTGAVDVGIFSQNVLLAAESLGLGGVFIGSLRNDMTTISKLLDLPHGVMPMVGMCLGHPAQEPVQRPRLPVTVVVSENRYRPASADELAQYDEVVHQYYLTRSNMDLTWSQQIAANLRGEVRPNALAYLQSQGFAKK
ncbi:oxygen-insensitive NADPH nitroreductase [Kingella kingae]|uniref:oxygen-insensitive NADPH nitroreductase n=3 Tax=Kingella kingae TaxID=504 RepID=UPI0002D7753A|nr:oxygen-insensitive NADPH nitroreductase [Kingella kingae]MDK4555901.1 oxygen-insensitive NADPH nitroreductase [Kingella kingae]MDK4585022.1 oxygen-insensitive NADPH nitroreductase [Kingella kingae]MDK4589010.1 oxygen-insensitive NADPH nitroreductase [Kingella kingae]MDK4597225.1 oxygen-insensitive NADPH nitroreductase [Kingella kingae]MDK4601180.1 oxygen-insensitive NADPH nitroreductase [Kingella kingae]